MCYYVVRYRAGYLLDDGVYGGVHVVGDVQGLGDHVGGALSELVLVVDHQCTAIGHHDRVCAWGRRRDIG